MKIIEIFQTRKNPGLCMCRNLNLEHFPQEEKIKKIYKKLNQAIYKKNWWQKNEKKVGLCVALFMKFQNNIK